MPITLSDLDLARLEATQTALLSALQFPDSDQWRLAVNRSVKNLFRLERAVFWLPVDGATPFVSGDGLEEAFADYSAYYHSLDEGAQVWNAIGCPPVVNRALLCGSEPGGVQRHRSSEIYRDWYQPHGIPEMVALLDPGDGAHGSNGTALPPAGLTLYHPREDIPEAGERALMLLRLLLPAFRAGVHTCVRLTRMRDSLANLLDSMNEALLVCDVEGRTTYRNRALVRLLAGDPETMRIEREVAEMLRALGALHRPVARSRSAGLPGPFVRDIQTASGSYRLRGSLAGSELLGKDGTLLIAVERTDRPLPEVKTLREVWGLTPAQARVARLMAQGKTNPEIASGLVLSLHTVRRHAEAVRMKLGVHSRAEVASKILRG